MPSRRRLHAAGAQVTLICGPESISRIRPGEDRPGSRPARDMLAAVERALPVDCAVFAAAVADWRVAQTGRQKIKKQKGARPGLTLMENRTFSPPLRTARPSGRDW